jgi:hypothetical protein
MTSLALPWGHARKWASLSKTPSDRWTAAGIALVLALQFAMVFTRAINWDEFWHYNHIVQLHEGTLDGTLRRLHAFAFAWVTALPGTNIDHIIVIRLFMLGCQMVTVAALLGVAMRFTDRTTALLCALAYVSFPYVFQHGASFRYDPPVTALLMTTLWLLVSSRLGARSMLAGGFLIALIPFASTKAVLYAPVFAGTAYLRWSDHRFSIDYALRLVLLGLTALATFAILHSAMSTMVTPGAGTGEGLSTGSVLNSVFIFLDNPNWLYIALGLARDPVVLIFLILGPVALARSQRPRPEKIALFAFFAFGLTPLYYLNTAPYFFVFLLPPVLIACSDSIAWCRKHLSASKLTIVLVMVMMLTIAIEPASPLSKQRQLRDVTIATFGEDVRYFDFPGFLGTKGKANTFISPLVVAIHGRAGSLMIRPIMEKETVPLVINNHYFLESALETNALHFLDPKDLEALRANYIHFWGPLWIAGREVRAGAGEVVFHNLVPGPYTVRDSTVTIDGSRYSPGEVVRLNRGAHRIESAAHATARLTWGSRIEEPATPPPSEPYWTQF